MKILLLADEESKYLWDFFEKEKLDGIDLIISCGDLKAEYLSFLATMAKPIMTGKHRMVVYVLTMRCLYIRDSGSPDWEALCVIPCGSINTQSTRCISGGHG